MSTERRLTETEAREFLALLEAVETDMTEAFSAASTAIFDDEPTTTTVAQTWGAPPKQVFLEGSRRDLRQFVTHAYLANHSE